MQKPAKRKSAKSLWLLYAMIAIYGIILSWFLYMGPYLTYVVNKKLAKTKLRIVVSLTTTPYRIDKIQATLDSMLQQSVKPDKIYLNIPYYLKRDNLEYKIPGWLQNYPGINIVRTEDYGPITKLLPTLQYEQDPQTIIITIDDDVWYPKHVVRDLVDFMLKTKNSAATPVHISFALNADLQFTNIKYKYQHASKTRLVIGAAGVAYRRSFFAGDFAPTITNLPNTCKLSDDLIISLYLASKRIDIQQVANASLHPLITPFTYKQLPYRFSESALSFKNGVFAANEANYCACLQQLNNSAHIKLVNVWLH